MEHTPCGCELRIQEVDGHLDTQSFKFCPLHAAAPALLEALEVLYLASVGVKLFRTIETLTALSTASEDARAAIEAAK